MTSLHALVLGILEGISEFLPISSTGHLILASELMRVPQTDFVKSFEIAIQFGAILSVVVLYFRRFFDIRLLLRLGAAFLPTALVGLLVYPYLKRYLLGNNAVVAGSLVVGGILLVIFELWHKEKEDALEDIRDLPYGKAALLGIFQAIAIIPGVSRSAATILGGLWLGLKRRTIAEFSFLLAVPTMAAATGLDLLKSAHSFSRPEFLLLGIGFVTSFFVALGSIVFLLDFIKKHTFVPFGIYRIALGLAFLLIWYT